MIVFKMVNCVISILTFILFCTKYSTVEAGENVKFVKTLTQTNAQDEQQDIHPPTFIDIWEHLMKDEDTNTPEKSKTREDENRNINSAQNNRRHPRHTNNGYSSIYPALTTPYPNVQFNPAPYRQPTVQQYGATQYTSNFNGYPVNQSYGNNSTFYRGQIFQNTTFNHPPYNSVSFRPAHPPGQNFYGNASTLNLAQRPYNQSKPQYPNTSFAPPNNWSSRPNYFNNSNQITNHTIKNPSYNPLGNLILNGYGSNYTHNNPVSGRPSIYSQNTTPVGPWFNKTTSRIPVNDRNNQFNNNLNQRINNTTNHYQYNGSRLNYPSYNTTNIVRNNTNIGPYQWGSTNSHNTTRFNVPSFPQKGLWSNSSVSRNPIYNQSNSFNRFNQNHWPYNQSLENSGNMNRYPSYNNGYQSSMPNYPVNNSSYSHQLPSNFPLKTDFQNSTRHNNIPNQNNYMEPNHFFYTPGYNLSSYDYRMDSAQKFSYA